MPVLKSTTENVNKKKKNETATKNATCKIILIVNNYDGTFDKVDCCSCSCFLQ